MHTPVRGEVELLPDQLVAVDEAGTITAVVPGSQEAACLAAHAGRPEDVLRLEVRIALGACSWSLCLSMQPRALLRELMPAKAQAPAAHPPRLEALACLTPRQANQFLLPGFCDTHIHASQYSYAGTATDTPLMAWLTKVRRLR